VTGVFQSVDAIQVCKHITGEWLLALSGIISILFGAALLYNPVAGALAVVWLIGVYAVLDGILLLALGIKLRGLERFLPHTVPTAV
jgi:uncharacterized membrane protein HdeD (DUF308 family)